MAKSMAQQAQPGRPGIGLPSPGRLLSAPTATGEQEPKHETMADMLRRHGALDDLPHLDRIGVRRTTVGYSETAFTKPAQDWSQFTLLELIAVQYSFLAASPNDGGGQRYNATAFVNTFSRLPFPDLAHLHISRPARDLKSWRDQVVDLTPVLESGDCAKDVRLEWGDVVEIPEADHPLYEKWSGFSNAEMANLKKCLTRKVELVIKDQVTQVPLAPKIFGLEEAPGYPGWPPSVTMDTNVLGLGKVTVEPAITARIPFWLRPVLLQSKLVLISSDLSRVKVTRRDPTTGQQREWIVDCSKDGEFAPDLWLENGDRIEVPEKTYASGSLHAEAPQRAAPGVAPIRAPAAQRPGSLQEAQPVGNPPRAADGPQAAAPLSYQGYSAQPQAAPAAEAPEAANKLQPDDGGVRYSPKAADAELLDQGYHRDRSAKPRQAEFWEQRATPDLSGRSTSTAVWTGHELVVFGGEGQGTSFADGARYSLAEDTWAMLPQKGEPSSRTGHAAVWTGKEMVIWGGFGGVWGNDTNRNDGARYNPSSDTWTPMSTRHAPSARFDCPAVWTGHEMLVWGGYTDSQSRYQGCHADAQLDTGGRYDPSSDTWKTIATKGAPSKRCAHTMVWTGKEMLVWGGANATKVLGDGGRYNPARDTWKPISTDGAPSPRGSALAVWTGQEMIVWGGGTREMDAQGACFESGARYDPDTDTWKPISTVGAPKGRVNTFAVWTGTEMLLWGGINDAQPGGEGSDGRFVGTGARYNPTTDTWTEITLTGAPSPRLTNGVWTGGGLLIFGGWTGTHLNETWLYSSSRTLYPYAKQ
jgi:N-acetylneuraminic acid mutarotase